MGNDLGNSQRRHRRPILAVLKSKTADRFHKKLQWDGECLIFMGTRNCRGYGFVDVMTNGIRTPILTHRLAWALAHGEDPPDDLMICHRCNNPRCCNPDHLYLGTAQDNSDDMVSAGRQGKGMLGRRGSDHPRAHKQERREEILSLIRNRLENGEGLNFLRIDRETGIHYGTIARWWREAGEK
ncbi:MAG: HNH endonuclease [Patescibacteria group bacterium]|nr:HNH endonuclease [Patescibacteria group bacterium]